jgi:hypothetical protein
MKPAQLEILVFTETHFLSMPLSEKYGPANQSNHTKEEQIEEAFWNGLYRETLVDPFLETGTNEKIILWKVTPAAHFLNLEYGAQLPEIEKLSSVNPYSFLDEQILS